MKTIQNRPWYYFITIATAWEGARHCRYCSVQFVIWVMVKRRPTHIHTYRNPFHTGGILAYYSLFISNTFSIVSRRTGPLASSPAPYIQEACRTIGKGIHISRQCIKRKAQHHNKQDKHQCGCTHICQWLYRTSAAAYSWTPTLPQSSVKPPSDTSTSVYRQQWQSATVFIKKLHCSKYKGLHESLWRAPGHNKPDAERALQLAKRIVHWMILILRNALEFPPHSLLHDHFQQIRGQTVYWSCCWMNEL